MSSGRIQACPGCLPLEMFQARLTGTQNVLEGLHSPSILGTPGCCWGEGCLERPDKTVATMTITRVDAGRDPVHAELCQHVKDLEEKSKDKVQR